MNHRITFDNCCNDWHNALPAGNGVVGAMAFYRQNRLCLALNHYAVYYRSLERYGRQRRDQAAAGDSPRYAGPTINDLEQLADRTFRDWRREPVHQYFESLHHSMAGYGGTYRGVSHLPTGELFLCFGDAIADPENSRLQLDLEQATLSFRARNGADQVEVTAFIPPQADYLITRVSQSKPGIVSSIILKFPQRRLQEGLSWMPAAPDDRTAYFTVSYSPPNDEACGCPPYRFAAAIRLLDQRGTVRLQDDQITLTLTGSARAFQIITAVFPDLPEHPAIDAAIRDLPDSPERIRQDLSAHRQVWDEFWGRSAIRLPDRFLETLWYMSLYVLACSSGKGGPMPEQACGLSGLWDIRQPTVWGSLWYWDVNIQAAFWPVYTANHLELGQVFCDGFLSYGPEAERFARDVYGADGWAIDYPHALYHCIAPWCAQFLWWQYEYGGDLAYLREKAYPCFRAMIRFIRQIIRFDPALQTYFFYPDISPEQGPLTHNSVITLSAVKYLLRFTIRAGELLGENPAVLDDDRELLARLADYPLSSDAGGTRLKDSEDAPTDLWLRHPSLLMPIYPVGEISRNSGERDLAIGRGTLAYARDNTEIGVFGFGWLSCAASRLGEGSQALRLLYEKGLDYCLRSNGLGYEETERWINYCCVEQQPLYYPPMMEASGEIAAAVNEMLLQSFDGVISVFPAMPDGRRDGEQERRFYEHEQQDRFTAYPAWDDCRFDRLLAKGGFEVSARRQGGRTSWILLKSLRGAAAQVRNSFSQPRLYAEKSQGWQALAYEIISGMIVFPTVINESYLICEGSLPAGAMPPAADWPAALSAESAEDAVLIHEAHTRRRIFQGEDEHTAYYKALDGFLFEYCTGNTRHGPMTVYKFDCGVPANGAGKDYAAAVRRQAMMTERQMSLGQTFIPLDHTMRFSIAAGFGFDQIDMLQSEDRQGPDAIRQDFVCGKEPAVFKIELPKGRYDFLVISGDAGGPSCTSLELCPAGPALRGRILRPGRYQCRVLPVLLEEDGIAALCLSSEPGYRWAVNAIFINKHFALL